MVPWSHGLLVARRTAELWFPWQREGPSGPGPPRNRRRTNPSHPRGSTPVSTGQFLRSKYDEWAGKHDGLVGAGRSPLLHLPSRMWMNVENHKAPLPTPPPPPPPGVVYRRNPDQPCGYQRRSPPGSSHAPHPRSQCYPSRTGTVKRSGANRFLLFREVLVTLSYREVLTE